MLGHCDTEKMISLYRTSNLFLLPSFSDPSPLSLIEAIRMRLPVLVSERCGNHFEAVIELQNGYVFDPFDEKSVISAYNSLFQRSQSWESMGKMGAELYDQRFNKSMVISRFVDELKTFSKRIN